MRWMLANLNTLSLFSLRIVQFLFSARTDEVVGTTLLSTQGILQDQRDKAIQQHGASLFQCFVGPLVAKGQSPKRVVLRAGIKTAFGLDYYISSKESASDSEKGKNMISGQLQSRVTPS